MEVVDDQFGVGKHLAGDRGGIGCRRVDDDMGDPRRKASLCSPSHWRTAVPVRSSTWPSRPWSPPPVDETGVPGVGAHPAAAGLLRVQRGLPRRVSSMPSTVTGAGSPNTASAWSMNAACAVGQTPRNRRRPRAPSAPLLRRTGRSGCATVSWCAAAPGTSASASVKLARSQVSLRQR